MTRSPRPCTWMRVLISKVRLHINTAGSRAIAREGDAGLARVKMLVVLGGGECAHCPLLLHFLVLPVTTELQLSGCYDQPNRTVTEPDEEREKHIRL